VKTDNDETQIHHRPGPALEFTKIEIIQKIQEINIEFE